MVEVTTPDVPHVMQVPRADRAQALYPFLLAHVVPGEQVDEVLGEKGPWLRLDTTTMVLLLDKILKGQSFTQEQLSQLKLLAQGVWLSDH